MPKLRQAERIPKKNWVPENEEFWEQGILTSGGTTQDLDNGIRSMFLPIVQGVFMFSIQNHTENHLINMVYWFDSNRSFIDRSTTSNLLDRTVVIPSNARFIRVTYRNISTSLITPSQAKDLKIQLEQGTTATPFEPYQLINRPAKRLKEWEYVLLDDYLSLNTTASENNFLYRISDNGLLEPKFAYENGDILEKINSGERNLVENRGKYYVVSSNVWFVWDRETPPPFPIHEVYKLAQPRYDVFQPYPDVFKEYEPKMTQRVGEPRPRTGNRRQPSYVLPWEFERKSPAIRKDGVRVMMDQPRLENRGVRIEEGTENLWGLGGMPTKAVIGSPLNFNTVISGNTLLTFHARSKSGGVLRVTNQMIGSQDAILTDEFSKFTFTIAPIQQMLSLWDRHSNGDIEIHSIQLEQKPHATSFTEGRRATESLVIPNAIPAEEGIIEFDVDFVVRNPNNTHQPIYDSPNARPFLLTRLTNGELSLHVHGLWRGSQVLQWQNKRYSFRIEYTKSWVKVWRDDVLVIDSAINPSTFTRSTMHLGMDNNKQRQTDLTFYNLVITDTETGQRKKWI